ncbi:MAG: hypothetical protein Q9201_005789 [Fulgogasparrea decipioides]
MRRGVAWLSLVATAAAFSIKNVELEIVLESPQHASAVAEVELGYEIHTAAFEEEGKFYNFSNIPYAKPPVGPLRFAQPEKPDTVTGEKPKNDVDVIVWFHGGGFNFGDKNQFGSPIGLIDAARALETDIIWVGVNYRLGAFGWLSAPAFIKEGGTSNVGLQDQKLALEWVKDNIASFGGDPKSITVMGESAGASSILHHLVSYGGPRSREAPPVFQRAIVQSPAFFPQADYKQEKAIYDTFLSKAGAKSLNELRALDEEVLKNASNLMIQQSPYGTFTFAPAVDDGYTPNTPSLLLKYNFFWPSIKVMVANNGDEGLLLAPPHVQSDDQFRSYVHDLFPAMPSEHLDSVLKKIPSRWQLVPEAQLCRPNQTSSC